MTGPSTNPTFKPQAFGNTTGVGPVVYREFTVEFFLGDPPDIATNFPRIWVNISNPAVPVLKFTANGVDVVTV